MAEVIWLDAAQRDAHNIYDFIARDSRRHAETTLRRIRASAELLGRFPTSGRRVPELSGTDFREVIAGSYRVIYRFIEPEDLVAIFAVVHGRRRLSLDIVER